MKTKNDLGLCGSCQKICQKCKEKFESCQLQIINSTPTLYVKDYGIFVYNENLGSFDFISNF